MDKKPNLYTNVSLFSSVKDIDEEDNFPLDAYLQEVKDGRWQDMVFPVRMEKEPEKRKKRKELLPTTNFTSRL